MNKHCRPMSLYMVFVVIFIFFGESRAKLAPSLYLFGDSTLDAGNSHKTPWDRDSKDGYAPYGIDFYEPALPRITNGYTVGDFFARYLGLNQLPPAFRHVNFSEIKLFQGFNYAYSGAGILPPTKNKEAAKKYSLWPMNKQVNLFKKTVTRYLPDRFKNPARLSHHLSRSIFLVQVGGNDYYLNRAQVFAPQNDSTFAQKIAHTFVNGLRVHLKHLYKLGARKFIVADISPIGCFPVVVEALQPKALCVDHINSIVQFYNSKLPWMLNQLRSQLEGSTFVRIKTYDFLFGLIENPFRSGLRSSANSCCVVSRDGFCLPHEVPCPNRDLNVFFDAIHPSEVVNKALASQCFYGKGVCVPMNIQELARKR